MLITNNRAHRSSYAHHLQSVMSIARAEESRKWLATWKGIHANPTPLIPLNELARSLGITGILIKDEAVRSPLGSFKALGAPVALVRLIMRLHSNSAWTAQMLFSGTYREELKDFCVISATDGNHGTALAAAAQSVGCRCVIVLHFHVSMEREATIRHFGAEIVRVSGNYDESVREAQRLAAANGWKVVSDTSYEGYEDVPRDVMQGYGTIAAEIAQACPAGLDGSAPFSHVFLQGGVGGLAAGIVSYFWELYGDRRPTIVIVEPEQADCLLQSAVNGSPSRATGSVDSLMAGLACGETSPLAWQFLESSADFFMTVRDPDAVDAMRILARGSVLDSPVVSGESGAAGLAGLMSVSKVPAQAELIGLSPGSRILLINTEGATAPGVYEELVGESAATVQARREARLLGSTVSRC